jgi:uncharacterized protein YbjT (DUF2867 family)
LPYTIVRPGWFDYNKPNQQRLLLLQGDRRQSGTPRDGVVARQQLAQVLVHALRSHQALNKTFELVAEAGSQTLDFDGLFATADQDLERAWDAVHDDANMPFDREPESVKAEINHFITRSSRRDC